MIRKIMVAFALTICISLCLTSCFERSDTSFEQSSYNSQSTEKYESGAEGSDDELTVHYFDVGQGDSIFLEFPDETCMLIDASVAKYGDEIVSSISEMGYEKIDYVIATHPHADHIGGMTEVLNAFEIGCIYLPDASASTNTYISLAETIINLGIESKIAEAGILIFEKDECRAEFIAPKVIDDSEQNRNSAVMLLTFGETRFLFMGDADTEVENSLEETIDCDVLKVGHHGSRTSSSEAFLAKASPAYAIISCGEGNTYGHPHEETINRLKLAGATILRTDLLGTIVVHSNGKEISVCYDGEQTETNEGSKKGNEEDSIVEESTAALWILNTNSMKIHCPGCKYVSSIAEHNRAESDKTIETLIEEGYSACGSCKPTD